VNKRPEWYEFEDALGEHPDLGKHDPFDDDEPLDCGFDEAEECEVCN
jgi:hypothetical protein